jgi:hypothetical protein
MDRLVAATGSGEQETRRVVQALIRGSGEGDAAQAAGEKKPEAYFQKYVGEIFESRTMQMAVDRSPSGGLLQAVVEEG